MKKIGYPVGLFLIACLISGWLSISNKYIHKTQWLLGTWENKTSRGSLFETWKWVNEMEMSGKSFYINNGDTVVLESIKLVEEADKLLYIPIVVDQNNGQPVRFEMKNLTDSAMVFENLSHDFPQVIAYRMIHNDSLVAEISGLRNGDERKIAFPMSRVND
ncbi:DUF6265 family protein [Pararhodonellum marinum]|uniref:DUF6265 family protein n=1 Tax=Pararhodonellum marinum TaxID=2755358 RepID=UPI00188EB1BE|nr:DUF6265 family protein [Pararhodonellum marinum]